MSGRVLLKCVKSNKQVRDCDGIFLRVGVFDQVESKNNESEGVWGLIYRFIRVWWWF